MVIQRIISFSLATQNKKHRHSEQQAHILYVKPSGWIVVHIYFLTTPPKTNISPENQWLEDEISC